MQNLQPTTQTDIVIGAFGIIDQAVLGLLNLRRPSGSTEPPRSLLLDIFQLHHGLAQRANPDRAGLLSKLTLLGTASRTGTRLLKEWQHVLRSDLNHKAARSPARVYRIASVAAASLVIPWLLLRRRR